MVTTAGDSLGTVPDVVSVTVLVTVFVSPPLQAAKTMRAARRLGATRKRIPAGVFRVGPQLLLDAQQLVVLGHAVAAAGRAGLDLARVGRNGQVRDRRVLRLARPVRNHRRIPRGAGERDCLERLGQRPDLVDLEQDRVGDAGLDPTTQPLDVRDEEVVADQLNALAEPRSQRLPGRPVLLRGTVLDRDDRIALDEFGPVAGKLLGRRRAPLEGVDAVLADQLRHRRIERDRDPLAMPRSSSSFFSVWKTSIAILRPSEKVSAPPGTIMNSWRSSELRACAPPLITFSIGTGSTCAAVPPIQW